MENTNYSGTTRQADDAVHQHDDDPKGRRSSASKEANASATKVPGGRDQTKRYQPLRHHQRLEQCSVGNSPQQDCNVQRAKRYTPADDEQATESMNETSHLNSDYAAY